MSITIIPHGMERSAAAKLCSRITRRLWLNAVVDVTDENTVFVYRDAAAQAAYAADPNAAMKKVMRIVSEDGRVVVTHDDNMITVNQMLTELRATVSD